MPTGDRKANIYNKRNMPQEAWEQYFLDFLDGKINDTSRAAFLQPGVLSDKEIGLTSSADDTFSLDISLADRGIDGFGHIVDLGNLDTSFYEDVPFENENLVDYYVGVRYQSVPMDVERNPRTTEPAYPWLEDSIGELGAPDSVTDNTTFIRLVLNGILESGVNHRGKAIRVWLNKPVSPSDTVAYYDGTVEYSGPDNYVDIPYSPGAGPLGQTAPTFPISTTALDYSCWIKSVSWFRNTDISTDDNYFFLGTVQGSGASTTPTVFDTTGQQQAFLISLDRAYRANSPDTPAPGRTIEADKYAVRISQSATSNRQRDDANTAFVLDKRGEDVVQGYGAHAYLPFETNKAGAWGALRELSDGTGNDLETQETVTFLVATDQVNFSRGGIDLTTFESGYLASGDAFCLIESTGNAAVDGLYFIDGTTVASNSLNLINLDGSSPSWPAGVGGKATVLLPTTLQNTLGWLTSSYDVTMGPAYPMNFAKSDDGLSVRMFDKPTNEKTQRWARFSAFEDSNDNEFLQLFCGRMLARAGGASYISANRTGSIVRGWSRYGVDIRDDSNLGSNWVPAETAHEWGFDWRGSAFGKVHGNDAPYQLPATFRIPYVDNDVDEEESFTQVDATTLQMAIVNTNMPFGTNYSVGMLFAEIEFATPGSADGVYLCYDKPAANQIEFKKLDGTAPTFPAGSGNVRFYGGSFFGPYWGDAAGTSDSFLLNLCSPNEKVGGVRYSHVQNDTIGATSYAYAALMLNKDTPMFGVRDGGQVFARAFTTRAIAAGHQLTQWDQVDSAYATIDEINLLNGSRELSLPDAALPGDFIIVRGDGTISNFGRAQRVQGGSCTLDATRDPVASLDPTGTNIDMVITDPGPGTTVGYYEFDLALTHGCTLNSVNVRVVPGIINSPSGLAGKVQRRSHTAGSVWQDLLAAGYTYTSGTPGVAETLAISCDQNNVINNQSYDYRVFLQSSQPTGATTTDEIHWATSLQDVSALGNNLFVGN
jgi:hypothetical protein